MTETTTGRSTELRRLSEEYAAHNYHPLPVVIDEAEGAWVTDVDGRRYLAIADGVAGSGPVDDAQQRYNGTAAVPYHLRRPDQVASFFDGLDLIEPGVVPCPRWKPDAPLGRPGAPAGAAPADEAGVYCGVARKP